MYSRRSLQKFLPPLILVCSLSAIYLSTLAPGLTWANDGSDGGDLIAAAATGGIAHPTGYPLYLLLARAFQFLPVGSLAFRTNLLSALTTVLAAALVYRLVRDASSTHQENRHWAAALAAGYAFGLAPMIWSQAVITEVYGLQALLVALILYLYTGPVQISGSVQKRLDRWRGLALGMAMSNHLTTVLLVPAALLLGSILRRQPESIAKSERPWHEKFELDRAALLRQVGMLGLGLSLYLILPVRAMANPPVNWGNAITLERFWWLVSGQLYQSYYLQFSPAEAWERIQSFAALLLQQFGLPGVALGVIGLVMYWRWSRLFILTLWTAVVFTVFAILYGSTDSHVYLMPAFLCFVLWIGLGIVGLSNRLTLWSPVLRIIFALLLTGYFAGRSMAYVSQVDASADLRAESFGRDVLSAVPENAILFAKGDRAVFALWYFHFALRERPDLAVLAVDLLHFEWYQEDLRSTYPSLLVPGPFPWPETITTANPSRPVCYVHYSDSALIDCSPPLEGDGP
jgi:hypothetical protein